MTDRHFDLKTLYAGLRAAGSFILTVNIIIAQNQPFADTLKSKWLYAGPIISGIGAVAEAIQAQQAKKKKTSVNNTTPIGDATL